MAQFTKEQAIVALKKAVAAGDNASANEWGEYIEALPVETSLYEGMLESIKGVPKLAFDTARAGTDALLMGGLDETASGLTAAATVASDTLGITDGEATFDEIYDEQMKYEKEDRQRFSDEHAVLSTGAELTGAILSPVNKALAAAKLISWGGRAAGIGQTANLAAQGAVGAVPYVFMTADGTIAERADVALSPTVLISSTVGGVLGGKVISVGKNFFTPSFKKSLDRPTTDNLRKAQNELYDKVAEAGITYSRTDLTTSFNKLAVTLKAKMGPDDKQATAAFRLYRNMVEKSGKGGVHLKDLDKLQRQMWERYNSTGSKKAEKTMILDSINAVGDLIAKHPNQSEVMKLARVASNNLKKAEGFDRVVKKMELDASFKALPPVDKMKQYVNKLLNDPNQTKYYEQVELDALEKFLANKGTLTEQGVKKLEKLAPNMQLSVLLGIGTGGASLGWQAAGAVVGKTAKGFGQRAQNARNDALVDSVKSGTLATAKPQAPYGAFTRLGGVPSEQAQGLVDQNERDMSMLRQKLR